MNRLVRELINKNKHSIIPQVENTSSVESALIALTYFESGAILVMKSGAIVGIFSERDFVRATVRGLLSEGLKTKVETIMNRDVVYVTPEFQLDECMAVMSKMKIRHLPVLKDGSVVSLLSMRQIMEALVEDKEFVISELTRYVTGTAPTKRSRETVLYVPFQKIQGTME